MPRADPTPQPRSSYAQPPFLHNGPPQAPRLTPDRMREQDISTLLRYLTWWASEKRPWRRKRHISSIEYGSDNWYHEQMRQSFTLHLYRDLGSWSDTCTPSGLVSRVSGGNSHGLGGAIDQRKLDEALLPQHPRHLGHRV